VSRSEQRLRQELEVLSRLARTLVSTTRLDDLLFEVARSVAEVLEFPDCVIYLWDEPSQRLVQRAAAGPKLDPSRRNVVDPLRLEIGQGIVGSAAANRAVQLVEDVRVDRRYVPDTGGGVSELAVPILLRDRLIGVLDAEDPRVNAFTAEDAIILTRFADLAAAAIVNVQAFERERLAADR
jgi:putative methionine-R-sulfoxide reductase with GAF domain